MRWNRALPIRFQNTATDHRLRRVAQDHPSPPDQAAHWHETLTGCQVTPAPPGTRDDKPEHSAADQHLTHSDNTRAQSLKNRPNDLQFGGKLNENPRPLR